MLRFLVVGVATVTLFVFGAFLGLLTEGDPPVPHVQLPDRGSTIAQSPGSSLEGLNPIGLVMTSMRTVAAERRAQAEQAAAEAAAAAEIAVVVEAEPAQPAPTTATADSEWDGTGTPCAIPQYICDRESGGDPTIYNPSGDASGKYQFIRSTWNGYGGYTNAADAPESVQDQKARELWADGAGCSHWSAC